MPETQSTVEGFFNFLNERHSIYLKRESGDPFPWTEDEILQQYRFCNVFRELDRTTIWFRENIREPIKDDSSVIMATIIFRSFNYIPTGKILVKNRLYLEWDTDIAISVLRDERQWVTGAYMIRSPEGMDKLHGVCWNIDQAWMYRSEITALMENKDTNLERAHMWLQTLPSVGSFTAYEFVTDLRWTYCLENSDDIYTWAAPGPGAVRGVNRLLGIKVNSSAGPDVYTNNMRELLRIAPDFIGDHVPPLEMRDIEHTLCEFDKYERARLNEGPMKSRFIPPGQRTSRRAQHRQSPKDLLISVPKKEK